MLADEKQGDGAGTGMGTDHRADFCQQGGFAPLLFQQIHKNSGILFAVTVADEDGGILFFIRTSKYYLYNNYNIFTIFKQ